MNATRVPGEVDAFATNYAYRKDGEEPDAAELRAVVTRIGMNRVARTVATGEGFANEPEADLLMVLALEGLDARAAGELTAERMVEADYSQYPGHGAG
jgi:hypothetical protein